MAAIRTPEGLFRILGYEESLQYPDYMDRGVVDRVHTSDAGFMISKVLNLLANRIGEKDLPTAFLSVGGRGMQMTEVQAFRVVAPPGEINQSLLDEMAKECYEKIEKHNDGVGALAIVPSYFVLDGKRQEYRPMRNQRCRELEIHYTAFVTHREAKDAIRKSFRQAGKCAIEEAFARPEALLSAFISVDGIEMLNAGCAILDIGARTTTLTICRGGQYLETKTVSQGSDDITDHIAAQGISKQYADQLKVKYGVAMPRMVTRNCTFKIPARPEIGGTIEMTSVNLAELIGSKLTEMLAPLIDTCNAYSNRIQCLYITGGGSMQQGIYEWIQSRSRIRVAYGAHNRLLTTDSNPEFCSPKYASLVGTLLLASSWRERHPHFNLTFKDFFWDVTSSLFGAPDESLNKETTLFDDLDD